MIHRMTLNETASHRATPCLSIGDVVNPLLLFSEVNKLEEMNFSFFSGCLMSKEQEHKYFNCQVMFYTIDYKYKVMHMLG